MKAADKTPEAERRGLRCPYCGFQVLRVIYTRSAWERKIVRRRECKSCRQRVTTAERIMGLNKPTEGGNYE